MKHRNFQLFIIGQLISLIGTWMQTTAQQWLVYELTGSVALLGVFTFANQVPMLLLAWMGGYVGDRYNRHRGVIVTQTKGASLRNEARRLLRSSTNSPTSLSPNRRWGGSPGAEA